MSIIASIFLTLIYIVYILLWFMGCGFIIFSFMKKTAYRKISDETSKNHLLDAILFISLASVCFSGLGKYLTVFDAIDKIKNLWQV